MDNIQKIITHISNNGFKWLSDNTLYNYDNKLELIIFDNVCSISNGSKKLYSGIISEEVLVVLKIS